MDRLPIKILQSMFEFFVADGGHQLVARRWRDATAGYSKLWTPCVGGSGVLTASLE